MRWGRLVSPPSADTVVTVIVDDGTQAVVRQVSPTATTVEVDTLARGRDLEILVALTRRAHVISHISRVRLRSTQTRTGGVRGPPARGRVESDPLPVPRLAPVEGLEAARPTDNADHSVELAWKKPDDNDMAAIFRFRFQHCPSDNCDTPEEVGGTPDAYVNQHMVKELTRNTDYHFRIQAEAQSASGYRDSEWSPPVEHKTDKTKLAAVMDLAANWPNVDADTKVDLTWTAPTDTMKMNISNFKVEHCDNAECSSGVPVASDVDDSSATGYTWTELSPNTDYHFRIQAIAKPDSDYLDSAWSSTVDITTFKPPLPVVVLSLTAAKPSADADTKVDLTWTAPIDKTNISSFNIQHCDNAECIGGGTGTNAASDATGYTWIGLSPDTDYYFRIRAIATSSSGYSEGAWSNIAHIKTEASSPN